MKLKIRLIKQKLNVFNVPKFNLKVYAFVYDELTNFSASDIKYKQLRKTNFL